MMTVHKCFAFNAEYPETVDMRQRPPFFCKGHPRGGPPYFFGWAFLPGDFIKILRRQNLPPEWNDSDIIRAGINEVVDPRWLDKYEDVISPNYAPCRINIRKQGKPNHVLVSIATNYPLDYIDLNDFKLLEKIVAAGADALSLTAEEAAQAKWHRS